MILFCYMLHNTNCPSLFLGLCSLLCSFGWFLTLCINSRYHSFSFSFNLQSFSLLTLMHTQLWFTYLHQHLFRFDFVSFFLCYSLFIVNIYVSLIMCSLCVACSFFVPHPFATVRRICQKIIPPWMLSFYRFILSSCFLYDWCHTSRSATGTPLPLFALVCSNENKIWKSKVIKWR